MRQILFQRGNVPDPTRYAQLLFRDAPDRFVQAAAGTSALRDAAMGLAYGADVHIALRVVAPKGAKMPPCLGKSVHRLDRSLLQP